MIQNNDFISFLSVYLILAVAFLFVNKGKEFLSVNILTVGVLLIGLFLSGELIVQLFKGIVEKIF